MMSPLPEVDPNEPQPPAPPREASEKFRQIASRIFSHIVVKGGDNNPFRSIREGWFVDLAAPKMQDLLTADKDEMLTALQAWEHWYSTDSTEQARDEARMKGLRAIANVAASCTCNPKPVDGQHWAGCEEGKELAGAAQPGDDKQEGK